MPRSPQHYGYAGESNGIYSLKMQVIYSICIVSIISPFKKIFFKKLLREVSHSAFNVRCPLNKSEATESVSYPFLSFLLTVS